MHDIMVQELMLSDVIEFFLLILIVYILYQCCLCVYRGISAVTREQQRRSRRRRRRRLSRNDDHRVPAMDDNLQQIRDDDTQQTAGVSSSNNCQASTISNVITAHRKELIENNLYFKCITREESVCELAMLLAASRVASRVGTTTLPIGEEIHNNDENNVSTANNNENNANELDDEEQQQEKTVVRMMKSNNNFDSNNDSLPLQHEHEEIIPLPLPSQSITSTLSLNQVLPPSFDYDFSMLKAQEQQHEASVSSSQQSRQIDGISNLSSSITITPGTANNKWNVIIKNVCTRGTNTTTTTTTSNTTHQQQQQCKIECSICLDTFTSGEEIAWAKDSGSTSTEVGCDHIFHRECLISWLQYHDECPLCRRLLIHADANVRFAGW